MPSCRCLLDFSRRQTLQPRRIEIHTLVGGIRELVERTVGPAIRVETRSDPDPWSARVDPPPLENARLNLCINARDAMPDGGVLTIETRHRAVDAATGALLGLPPGDYVCLR